MTQARDPFELIQSLGRAEVLTPDRLTAIRDAMRWQGVGSIRVGCRVFECPAGELVVHELSQAINGIEQL